MTRYFLSAIFALTFTACSTTPVSTSRAQPVPADRQLLFAQSGHGLAEIIVKRDTGLSGGACSTEISIDGKPAAYIRTGEKVIFYVTPGEHFVSAEPHGICPGGLIEQKTIASTAKRRIFRVGIDNTGSMGLYPTTR
jgi:hypothetical protein